MTDKAKAIEIANQVLPGDSISEFVISASGHMRVEKRTEDFDGTPETIIAMPDIDVEVLTTNGETVEAISYGTAFPGKVNGIAMGMLGDEVEQILGPSDRLWPMPHPNYVLLYDAPTFFRV